MQYHFPLTLSPNTQIASPTRLTTKLCIGILEKISVYFPWGCAGLVGIRILHYEHQLCPTNRGEWFTGNEINIEFRAEYFIWEGENDFKIEGYNLDDFYEHTPLISYNVLRGGLAVPTSNGWVEG